MRRFQIARIRAGPGQQRDRLAVLDLAQVEHRVPCLDEFRLRDRHFAQELSSMPDCLQCAPGWKCLRSFYLEAAFGTAPRAISPASSSVSTAAHSARSASI